MCYPNTHTHTPWATAGLGAALEAKNQLGGALRCAIKVLSILEKTVGAGAAETVAAGERVELMQRMQAAQKDESKRNADARRC